MKTYTLTRRHDNAILETGVHGYLNAITKTEAYRGVDVIIHEDGTDWMEEKRKVSGEYDATQAGFAFI